MEGKIDPLEAALREVSVGARGVEVWIGGGEGIGFMLASMLPPIDACAFSLSTFHFTQPTPILRAANACIAIV